MTEEVSDINFVLDAGKSDLGFWQFRCSKCQSYLSVSIMTLLRDNVGAIFEPHVAECFGPDWASYHWNLPWEENKEGVCAYEGKSGQRTEASPIKEQKKSARGTKGPRGRKGNG